MHSFDEAPAELAPAPNGKILVANNRGTKVFEIDPQTFDVRALIDFEPSLPLSSDAAAPIEDVVFDRVGRAVVLGGGKVSVSRGEGGSGGFAVLTLADPLRPGRSFDGVRSIAAAPNGDLYLCDQERRRVLRVRASEIEAVWGGR